MSLNHRSRRLGLTLIEILVGLTMTLIVLGAMMFAFRYASQEISRGRAMMELSNQLRVAQDLLRSDFDGITVDLRPWAKTAGPNGYFEYIEGFGTDKSRIDADLDGFVDPVSTDAIFGDVDDIVAMTVRSESRPFRGRFNGQVIESNIAEIVWWTSFVDRNGNNVVDFDEPITLRRRVLLIRPDLIRDLTTSANSALTITNIGVDVQEFFLVNDISARVEDIDGDGNVDTMVPNSLADLSKRENRFAHLNTSIGVYPYAMQRGLLSAFEMTIENMRSVDAVTGVIGRFLDLPSQAGDDIVISDITSFDLKVYSPDTPIRQNATATTFEPHDVGYLGAPGIAGLGAFVDLAYARGPGYIAYDPTAPAFSTAPTLQSQLAYADPALPGNSFVVYDTFSTHYESDGIDTDGDGLIDEGTDGIDNDNANGVDDNLERETLPPYPNRVLGVKATIRIVERNSKQVRQTEVISSFVPQ